MNNNNILTKNSKKLKKQITTYSMAASVIISLNNQSDAAIQYTNPPDITLTNEWQSIDIDGNGLEDFEFKFQSDQGQALIKGIEWTSHSTVSLTTTLFNYFATQNSWVKLFSNGQEITGAVKESTYALNKDNGGGYFNNSEGYIGFKIDYGNGVYIYNGWIRYEGNTSGGGTIKDWAYDDSGASIKAGEKPPVEINIKGNGQVITDGSTLPILANHTDFGEALLLGGTVARTFTIENAASGDLELIGDPIIAINGANASDFSVTQQPTNPLTGLNSTIFEVTFSPSGVGERNATLVIENSDSDENPYNFNIKGIGSETTTWNGSVWSLGIPNKFTDAIIAGDLNINSDLEVRDLNIESGIITFNGTNKISIFRNIKDSNGKIRVQVLSKLELFSNILLPILSE